MKIPQFDLTRQYEQIEPEILSAVRQVLRSGQFILGAEGEAFEAECAAYLDVTHAIGLGSGSDAIKLVVHALGVGPDTEVVTPAFSFVASATAALQLGARPVFVDIDPATYNIDPARIERAISPNTKAIIPVHLYGQCADMAPVMSIAQRHGLHVIEDAAQAIGADYVDGRRAGSIGTVGCFSFFPSKNLGAMGDGGMVVTNDLDLAERIRVLRVHGSKPKYYHRVIGGNFRLDSIQAAVLNVKLNYLDEWTRRRQENAARYRTLFKETGLTDKPGIVLPEARYQRTGVKHDHIYNQFVIRVSRRDQLMAHLTKQGIGSEIYYPVPFHLQECFRALGYNEGDFPESERAAKETLALPIYQGLTADQQTAVVKAIRGFYVL